MLGRLKYGFKRTISWNKYRPDTKAYARNPCLSNLIDLSFQGLNRLFVLLFEKENGRTSHSDHYLTWVEIKDYNVKIDGRKCFDQPVNSNIKTYKNIRKIAAAEGDN